MPENRVKRNIGTHKVAVTPSLRENPIDKKLIELQQDGWKIISVFNIPYKEYEPREGYFDSVQFAIIAEHE